MRYVRPTGRLPLGSPCTSATRSTASRTWVSTLDPEWRVKPECLPCWLFRRARDPFPEPRLDSRPSQPCRLVFPTPPLPPAPSPGPFLHGRPGNQAHWKLGARCENGYEDVDSERWLGCYPVFRFRSFDPPYKVVTVPLPGKRTDGDIGHWLRFLFSKEQESVSGRTDEDTRNQGKREK